LIRRRPPLRSKVLNLFARKPTDGSGAETTASKTVSESDFADEIRKNMENSERLKKERLKANQGVLKSYRIKN